VYWHAASPTWTDWPASPVAEEEAKRGGSEVRRARHRRGLAEPEPSPKRLAVRKERAVLRALLKVPTLKKVERA
jgi:hypothetical protein